MKQPIGRKVRRKRAGKFPGKVPVARPDRRRRSADNDADGTPRAEGGAVLRALGAKTPTEGLGMVLGAPGDAYDMLHRGYTYGVTKGAEKLGLISPDEGDELRRSTESSSEPAYGSKAMTRYLQGAFGQGSGAGPSDDAALSDRHRGGPVRGPKRSKR